jgi:predicted nucleotidyltransferase
MDLNQIKLKTIQYFHVLQENGIRPDLIVLFGSYAKRQAKKNSDVDLAVISRDFGKDCIKEGAKANRLLMEVFPEAEVITISLKEYLSKNNISPILYEIKKTGIALI